MMYLNALFNMSSFDWSLPILLQGMFGIFCVTGVIILTTLILEKTTGKDEEK